MRRARLIVPSCGNLIVDNEATVEAIDSGGFPCMGWVRAEDDAGREYLVNLGQVACVYTEEFPLEAHR